MPAWSLRGFGLSFQTAKHGAAAVWAGARAAPRPGQGHIGDQLLASLATLRVFSRLILHRLAPPWIPREGWGRGSGYPDLEAPSP
eukprot:2121056-Pyramimonas_sp.AAC.1